MKYLIVVFIAVLFPSTSQLLAGDAKTADNIAAGKELAFGRKKGNCLTCHYIAGGKLTGTSGPALVAMKARFPKRAELRAQIWDASEKNRFSVMPPFGRHAILTEKEIDLVVDYIHSL